jgi:hypothetical protein
MMHATFLTRERHDPPRRYLPKLISFNSGHKAANTATPARFCRSFTSAASNSTVMKLQNISSFSAQFERLSIRSQPLRPLCTALPSSSNKPLPFQNGTGSRRPFSGTTSRAGNWLLPTMPEKKRSRKGRPRVPTGGSARGTTIVWGDYGLRMCDHHRRVSAAQLKVGEEAIKVRLKGMRYRLYKRVCASIGVYSSGNEVCLD